MNAWLIRHYFIIIHQVSEGHFERSTVPNTLLSTRLSLSPHLRLSLSVTHTNTHTQDKIHTQPLKSTDTDTHEPTQRSVTHSSKMTAQSGRKRRCVSPAPCMPMKMSELWVIFSCSRKGTSLKREASITHIVWTRLDVLPLRRLCGAHSLVFVVHQVDLQERNGLECIHQLWKWQRGAFPNQRQTKHKLKAFSFCLCGF